MKLLIDMNLSPAWVQALESKGFPATHWSSVGDARAPDRTLMEWARENGHVVFTNDLDFGAILSAGAETSPSVIQVRAQDVTPAHLLDLVIRALEQHRKILQQGALITVDESRLRVRILPLDRGAG